MLKRIFLAGTIAFPLYLMIAIQPSPPLADSRIRSPIFPDRVTKNLDRQFKNFHEEFQRTRSTLLNTIEAAMKTRD